MPESPTSRAALLARWTADLELKTIAALVLEPRPSSVQWREWYDITSDPDLDDETVAALRRLLAMSPNVVTARHAVRHPNRRAGRALAAVLSQTSVQGFTGDPDLLHWLSYDEQAGREAGCRTAAETNLRTMCSLSSASV